MGPQCWHLGTAREAYVRGHKIVEEFLRVLNVLNAAVIVTLPGILWIGSRWFASKDTTERAFKLDREATDTAINGLKAELLAVESRLRQDMNNGISSVSAHGIQQYSGITAQLTDLKRALDVAQERAHDAHDVAVSAMHKAERAEDKIVALDRLINTRLDNFTSQMHGIEKLLRQYAEDVQKAAGASKRSSA